MTGLPHKLYCGGRLLLLSLCLFLIAPDAQAIALKGEEGSQKKKDQHWCSIKDILGAWNLIFFQETPPGKETAFHRDFPYEQAVFSETGRLAYMNLNRPSRNLKDAVLKLQSGKAEAGYSYRLGKDGRLQFLLRNKPYRDSWCQVVPKAGGGYQKGDILLTSDNGGVSTVRAFRKILLP